MKQLLNNFITLFIGDDDTAPRHDPKAMTFLFVLVVFGITLLGVLSLFRLPLW
ncbi:MAG: hypothetical protein RIG62_32090 [Cyclobacteriaceae bacterium]